MVLRELRFNPDTLFFKFQGVLYDLDKVSYCSVFRALLGEKTIHLWEVSDLLLGPVKVLEKEFMRLSNEDDVSTMIYRLNSVFKVILQKCHLVSGLLGVLVSLRIFQGFKGPYLCSL